MENIGDHRERPSRLSIANGFFERLNIIKLFTVEDDLQSLPPELQDEIIQAELFTEISSPL